MGLDRNTLIGISLICAIMFAWMWYSAPTKEEIAKKRVQDSLAVVEKNRANDTVGSKQTVIGNDSVKNVTAAASQLTDSTKKAVLNNKYDVFASAAIDTNDFFTLENEKIKATVCKKGGRI